MDPLNAALALLGTGTVLAAVPQDAGTTDLHAMAQEWLAYFDNPWIAAGTVVLVSLLLARVVDKLVTALLRFAARRTATTVDDEIIGYLHGPIVKSVVLGGLWMACDMLATEERPLLWLLRGLITLVVLSWTGAALRVLRLALRLMAANPSRFHAIEERTLPLFHNVAMIVVLAAVSLALIRVWDLDATGWLASAGVAGIALGFAARDTLANLFSGVFIIADAPYRIGDYVNLESGQRGRVVQIGLRSTRIHTRDDVEITVPNSIIGNGAIVNESSGAPRYRLRVAVGVAYGSDIDRVRAALLGSVREVGLTLPEPEPRVRFRRFGDSALEFELLAWISMPEDRGKVTDALNTAIYKRFAGDGIEIPFPQRDVHVRSVPPGWPSGGGDADG